MKQKDWIVYGPNKNNLLCLTIVEDGGECSLVEFVNYFGLSKAKLKEMVDMGYDSMLKAMKETDYEYVIAKHTFSEEDFNEASYLQKLLPAERVGVKKSFAKGKLVVDKKKLEKEISKLVPKADILHKGEKTPSSLEALRRGEAGEEIPKINITICNSVQDVKDKYAHMTEEDKHATQLMEKYDKGIKDALKES